MYFLGRPLSEPFFDTSYVETVCPICFSIMMTEQAETISWSILARPYGQAERALGRLAHGLDTTPLHPTWLWRETTRIAVTIAQASGYHAKVDQLRAALIGAPVERENSTPGLAAARRVFLASVELFRAHRQADSDLALWPRFWSGEPPQADDDHEASRAGGVDGSAEEMLERDQLMQLVRELAGFADDGRRPALINLFIDLRQHAATRHLSPQLVRIALPLALREAGLVPKAAPGLLGGRRLPLGFSRAIVSEEPLTDWLARALEELAKEADQSYRRLVELTSQHQAWHDVLAKERLRKHALAPRALDLLAATPVLSIGLVARHLGCSHVAAGKVIERLVDLGILIEQTSRARHKLFVAGDLPERLHEAGASDGPLVQSAPLRPVDLDALNATLDGVLADLDRQTELTKTRLAEG